MHPHPPALPIRQNPSPTAPALHSQNLKPSLFGNRSTRELITAGRTPLHEAASWNHLDTLQVLIRYGANPKARTTMGLTALHFALDGGERGDLIDYLISQDIDVNATSHFGTPLLIAAIENQQEAMQKLLRLEANPNASPDGMLSPLHASILNCSLKSVKTLLLCWKETRRWPRKEACPWLWGLPTTGYSSSTWPNYRWRADSIFRPKIA